MQLLDEKITVLVVIIVVFSTNYMIHIAMSGQNANSHNDLFLSYALIPWFTILWRESNKPNHMVLLAMVCGLTIRIIA
jgi:hypothetical protein